MGQDKKEDGSEPLYLRDYQVPLAEETYDKNLLPKAMQVRRGFQGFGKMGQTKHTHLTDVDTTDKTAAWAATAKDSKVVGNYQNKMAGMKASGKLDRPSARGR